MNFRTFYETTQKIFRGKDLISRMNSENTDFYDSEFVEDLIDIKNISDHQMKMDTLRYMRDLDKMEQQDRDEEPNTEHQDKVTEMMKGHKKGENITMLFQPIIVTKKHKDGSYGVWDGHHRLTALNELGAKKVKVFREL